MGRLDEPKTQWWYQHPNRGWLPCAPCDAGGFHVEINWPVFLGDNPPESSRKMSPELSMFHLLAMAHAKALGLEIKEEYAGGDTLTFVIGGFFRWTETTQSAGGRDDRYWIDKRAEIKNAVRGS